MPVLAQNPVRRDERRQRALGRHNEMRKAFDSRQAVLRDIKTFLLPWSARFENESQDQRGSRPDLKVINGVAQRSFAILSSGMMAGLTSPGRPWFKLTLQDPDLAEFGPVRSWLDDTARAMRGLFARSNFYNVLPSVYKEIAGFGTTALLEVADPRSVIRFVPFTLGTYGIAQDDRLVVDCFSREYKRTVRQLVDRFGTDNLSQAARQAWQSNKLETEFNCVHMIEANVGQRPGAFGHVGMPFVEEYWEKASDKLDPLARSGYQERALFVPRWEVNGDDLWGTGLGHQILGDNKQLQFLERRKEDVLEKHTAPPLEASAEMRGKRISLLSGDVTFTNPGQTGGAQVRPIIQTHPQAYQYVREDIGDMMTRIRQACFEDLFLMLANDTRSGITAREVEERHQEKMLVLGPVLERLNEELFDPIIDRTYAIMQRASEGIWRGQLAGTPMLPKPPAELEEMDIHVEYTSILAQAAKATNTRGLEAFGMFVGQMAQMDRGVLDKVDWDQMVDEYADAQGVPARVVRDDDSVAHIRDGRAQQEQAAQMAQMAQPLKDTATALSTLASTRPVEDSLAGQLGQAGLAGAPQ